LRILMISYWDFQKYGMQVTLRTPLYFANRGHTVTFLVHSETTANPTPIDNLPPNLTVVRFDLPFKWLSRVPGMRRPRQFLLFLVYCVFYALRRCRGTATPDVIYAAEADAVLIGSLLRRLYRVPLVTRFYGVARIAAYFDPESRAFRRFGLRHALSRAAMKCKADMIIITDDGTNGVEVMRAINPSARNIKFWKNGVDGVHATSDAIAGLRRTLGLGPDDRVLLTLCRLDRMKKVDRAIRAIHHLERRGVKHVKLVVAGDGNERADLERLAEELGVRQSIQFAGKVSHECVYDYYALADVFLSLYDHSNVGNTLLEALNAGCCIVTLKTGGTGQVITDGANGRLLEVNADEEAMAIRLADVVEELLAHPERRSQLAAGAKAYARENLWTWDDRLQTELDAITQLVQGDHLPSR